MRKEKERLEHIDASRAKLQVRRAAGPHPAMARLRLLWLRACLNKCLMTRVPLRTGRR